MENSNGLFSHQQEVMLKAEQISLCDEVKYGSTSLEEEVSPFARNPKEEDLRRKIAHHKLWMESMQHEYPSPYVHYRIGVYIRFFNQTKYENYLLYHKQEFADTIALCPNWTLVGFYVDEGQTAPFMENAKEWSHLLQECMDGKIDLIITQKIANVSRNSDELTFCARMLATQEKPIGIYFINENIFTLASYYLKDMREKNFIPDNARDVLSEEITHERGAIIE